MDKRKEDRGEEQEREEGRGGKGRGRERRREEGKGAEGRGGTFLSGPDCLHSGPRTAATPAPHVDSPLSCLLNRPSL